MINGRDQSSRTCCQDVRQHLGDRVGQYALEHVHEHIREHARGRVRKECWPIVKTWWFEPMGCQNPFIIVVKKIVEVCNPLTTFNTMG